MKLLGEAGMTVDDIVKVTQYLTWAEGYRGLREGEVQVSGRCAAGFHVACRSAACLARDSFGDRSDCGKVVRENVSTGHLN
jgi:hypothetical protein